MLPFCVSTPVCSSIRFSPCCALQRWSYLFPLLQPVYNPRVPHSPCLPACPPAHCDSPVPPLDSLEQYLYLSLCSLPTGLPWTPSPWRTNQYCSRSVPLLVFPVFKHCPATTDCEFGQLYFQNCEIVELLLCCWNGMWVKLVSLTQWTKPMSYIGCA